MTSITDLRRADKVLAYHLGSNDGLAITKRIETTIAKHVGITVKRGRFSLDSNDE